MRQIFHELKKKIFLTFVNKFLKQSHSDFWKLHKCFAKLYYCAKTENFLFDKFNFTEYRFDRIQKNSNKFSMFTYSSNTTNVTLKYEKKTASVEHRQLTSCKTSIKSYVSILYFNLLICTQSFN